MESYVLLYRDNEFCLNYEVYWDVEFMLVDDYFFYFNKFRLVKFVYFKLEEDKISYKENIIVDLLLFVVKF